MIEDSKGVAVFVLLLAGIVAIGILSAHQGFLDPTATAETKRWSPTVLSALVTGGIGLVIGRKVGK